MPPSPPASMVKAEAITLKTSTANTSITKITCSGRPPKKSVEESTSNCASFLNNGATKP